MARIELQIIKDLSDERWTSLVTSSPQANLFCHPTWMMLLAECYGYRPFILTACREDGKILAGLPMMEIQSLFNRQRWVSLPFTDYCPLIIQDKQGLDYLATKMVQLFHEEHLIRIELRCEMPENPEIKRSTEYALHTLKLEADFGRIAKGFDRTHRQNVRQAEKYQIRIEWGNTLEHMRKFYSLQLETRRRHGIPGQPWNYFRILSERLFNNGLGTLLLAYKDDQCIAGLVLLYWKKKIICKYAASLEESLNLRPNDILFWTAIRWGCENGYTLFDMGRTDLDNPGLCRFKRGWGADEFPLTYSTIYSKKIKPYSRVLMKFFCPIIKKSPLWLCQIAGELFYQQFG